jgi:hypothetical protein
MNRKRAALMAVVLSLTSVVGTAAWADRGFPRGPSPHVQRYHHNGGGWGWFPGLVLGSALVWAATRPPVVYAEPAPVVVAPAPPVVQVAPPSGDWWYYCRPAGAYYPYVQSCPTAWERVPAQPSGW